MGSESAEWLDAHEHSSGELRAELAEALKTSDSHLLSMKLIGLHDAGKLPQEFEKAAQALAAWSAERQGAAFGTGSRTRKISVSMPEDLSAAVRERVGPGEFSSYVTEAVTRQLELDLLAELSTLLEDEYGPVSEGSLAEAETAWPDAD